MALDLQSLIQKHRHQVDFIQIRLEQSEGTDIVLRGEILDTLSQSLSVGGNVRVCHKGAWGFASFNRLDKLEERLLEAITSARLTGTDVTELAPVDPVVDRVVLALKGADPRTIPLARKKSLVHHYNELLRHYDPRITSTVVRYGDTYQHVTLATSEGTFIEQEWVDLEMRFSATARDGETVQTGRETHGSRQGYEDLEGLDERVKAAAERAVTALSLSPAVGGNYTVVIDPILSGLFVHEAFGHLSEADMAYENPDLLEVMTLGRRFGPKTLNIKDGALPTGHRGSYRYDDEGVPATTTTLIHEGELVGRLHSRETAGKLGEQPTGNARALDYHHTPIVRMTNTWIERGDSSVESLLSDLKEGLYCRNWLGGMTNGEMFTFAAGEAWMVRKGQLCEQVRDVNLSGNVFQTLSDIEGLGNDFYWDESGGCGKGGQNGLAVGCAGPSLRIRNVLVGGS